MSIGGLDPTANAGVIVDAITCRNIGVKYITLVSALTAQNSKGLSGIEIISEGIFKKQFEELLEDYYPKVIKTGMIPAKYQIDLIADYVKKQEVLLVVDPVKSVSCGGDLVSDDIYDYMIKKLFPVSYLVTPNIPEAELIISREINNANDMVKAAKDITKKGPYATYLKGGHLKGEPVDILCFENDISKFKSEMKSRCNLRGTGCMLASSISSYLFMGDNIIRACSRAKKYIDNVFKESVSNN